jgi:hypothetical protein
VRAVTVSSTPRSRSTTATATARLELLEYYLAHHEDLAACAQASLDWLAKHAGIRRSVCLVVDSESSTLVGVAGCGVPTDHVEMFSWPLSDTHDPLTSALSKR